MKHFARLFLVVFMVVSVLALSGAGEAGALTWISKAPISPPTSRSMSASVGGKLWVLGGDLNDGVQAYDPVSDIWETGKTPLPVTRWAAGEATAGTVIYLVGGMGPNYPGQTLPADRTVFAYDTATGSSWYVGSLANSYNRCSAAYLNGKIYVAGGTVLEEFDPQAGVSVNVTNFPGQETRYLPFVAAANGRIFVIGGADSDNTVRCNTWEYDPVTHQFDLTQLNQPMNLCAAGKSALSYNDKIITVGGVTGMATFPPTTWTNAVQQYDPLTDSWQSLGEVPNSRFALSNGIVNGTLYVIGGDACGYGTPSCPQSVNESATLRGDSGPVVVSASPYPGETNVSLYSPAVVNFDRLISGAATFTVIDSFGNLLPGGWYPNNQSLYFYPNTAMAEGRMYTASVTEVSDYLGNTLPSYSWSFTTERFEDTTPPMVNATTPMSGEGNVSVYSSVSITFSEAIDPSTVGGTTFAVYDWRGPVDGTWTTGGNTVTFTPALSFSPYTTYSAEVNGVRDLAGNQLPYPYYWSFTTGDATPAVQGWQIMDQMPVPVSRAASAAVNGAIYVLGGGGGSTQLNTVQVYDTRGNVWPSRTQPFPPLYQSVSGPAAGTFGNTIYLAGGDAGYPPGQTQWLPTDVIQSYDTTSGASSLVGRMSTGRIAARAAVLNRKMYVVGGMGQSLVNGVLQYGRLDTIEAIDLESGQSAPLTVKLPEALVRAGVAAYGNKLYIVGGSSPSGVKNTSYEFDPTAPAGFELTPKAPMPIAGEVGNLLVHNGKLYVVGLSNGPSSPNGAILEYDVAQNSWMIVEYIPTTRSAFVAQAVNGVIYAIGGDSAAGLLDVNEAWGIGTTVPPTPDLVPPTTTTTISGTQGANGWYTSDVTVALSAVDNDGGSGVVRTEYDTYGSSYFQSYSAPLLFSYEQTTTLRYRSIDRQGNTETANTAIIPIDKTRPSTSISLSGTAGTNGWYRSDVTITLSATDGYYGSGIARIEYSFNGIDWYTYTAPYVRQLEGTSTVYYRSVDNAGHVEATKSQTFKMDKTIPATSITAAGQAGQNGWHNSDVAVTLSAVDNSSGIVSVQYSFDNSNWSTYTAPLTITTEGTTTVYCRATDGAGNTGSITDNPPYQRQLTIKIDKSAPKFLPSITRASLSSGGVQANGNSYSSILSADGRYIAFWSGASNLVAGDTNGTMDVFVRDLANNTTERVSLRTYDPANPNQELQAQYPLNVRHYTDTYLTGISADGRYVTFSANADNLAAPFGTLGMKVFLRDRETGVTEMISVSQSGVADNSDSNGGSVSADGRYVAFSSAATQLTGTDLPYRTRVYVKDRQTGAVECVSGLNADNSTYGGEAISADGRYVLFQSNATNLVPGDTNGAADLFIYDRQTGTTRRVNVRSDGGQAQGTVVIGGTTQATYNGAYDMSADGRYVAFESNAKNLVDGFTYNNNTNVYLHDMQSGTTVLVNTSADGARLNRGWSHSLNSISPDGRHIAYKTEDADVIPDAQYLFYPIVIRDMQTGANEALCSDGCSYASISTGREVVAFSSTRTTLVPGDTNGATDIFTSDIYAARLNGNMGDNGWYAETVQVDLPAASDTVSGLARREYSINGGPWTSFSAPFALASEGAVTFAVRPVDNSGLVGQIRTRSAKADLTPPTTIAEVAYDGSGTAILTLTAVDAASGVAMTEYRISGGAWTAYSAPVPLAAGTSTLFFRSTDNAGLVETEKQVEVRDSVLPVVTAPADVVAEATGTLTAVAIGTATATDNVAVVGISSNAPELFPTGTTTVTWTATDAAGNSGTATQAVTVLDTTAPVITVPSAVTVEATGFCSTVAIGAATATDLFPVTVTSDAPTCFEVGAATVTWTATDANGRSSSGTQTVTVTDTTPPVMSGLENLTLEATSPAGAAATFTVTAVDLVNGEVTVACGRTSGSTFAIGTTTVDCTATDAAGTLGSGSFTITVQDTTLPVITVPANITVEATGFCSTVAIGAATATDLFPVTVTSDAPTCFQVGAATVTWTATDANGRSSNGTQIVTVTDTTPPVLHGLANLTLEATSPSGAVATFTITATDTVDGSVPVVCDRDSGSTFALGSTIVACRAVDAAGRTGIGSFLITVQDTIKPVVSGAATTSPNADGWYTTPVTVHFTASDSGSGIAGITPDVVIGTEGANQSATGTATDLAGNSAGVTIGGINIDMTAPSIQGSSVGATSATFTYNEPVRAGTLRVLYKKGKSFVPFTVGTVEVAGSTLTVTGLARGATYVIQFESGAVQDRAGLASLPQTMTVTTLRR